MMTAFAGASGPRKPDFAYPRKVSEDSEKQLAAALKNGRDVEAIRALMNLTLAENAIDSDRMPACLARIDSVGRLFSLPAPRAVIDLLRASIYSDYFNSQRYTIEQRPDVDGPAPADYTEWNAGQFRARIAELLNSAMANPEALAETPLRDYDPLLDIPARDARMEYMFYPSLLDFVGGQAIDLIGNFRTPDARALAEEYRNTLIRFNTSHPAPLIVNRIAQITGRAQNGSLIRRELISLYHDSQGNAFCGEALIALGDITDRDDIEQCREVMALADEFMEHYPTYVRINCLKNILANMVSRRAQVDVPATVAPGDMLRFNASVYNLNELTVTLYRLPDSFDFRNNSNFDLRSGVVPPSLRKIASRNLAFAGTAPFRAQASDSIRVLEPGCYIALAEAPGMRPERYPSVIHCSALAISGLRFGSSAEAVVVNPVTGVPVADAAVSIVRGKSVSTLGSTSADGMLGLTGKEYGSYRIYPVKGNDRFARAISLYRPEEPDTSRRYYCEAYTDLALYHPGDTVKFAAILYSIRDQDYRTERGLTVQAELLDANNQPVDTLTGLVADSYGRVTGSFAIPDDGRLNGQFSIRLTGSTITGWAGFMVSDYKLPTFEVKVTDCATDTPEKGAVTIRGNARTYSGMPVAEAGVIIEITREMLWRRWMPDNDDFQSFTLTAVTDANGDWQAVAPADKLLAAGRNAWFRASVTVTSTAGENQAAQSVFTLGPALRIDAPLADSYNIADTLRLPVRVIDTKGDPVPGMDIAYKVMSGDKSLLAGTLTSDNPVVDWHTVTPGTYEIELAIEGDTARCREIKLFNPAVNRSPSTDLLWTPRNSVTLGIDGTTDILLGTSMDTTYVLYTLYDYEKIVERRWLTLPAGLHRVTATAQRGGNPSLTASFITVGRYQTQEEDVTILPAINPRDLKIRAEVMRDRIIPGTAETWRFTVVNATGTAVEAAVMMDMYNKALDALRPFGWHLNVASPQSLSLSWRRPTMLDALNRTWLSPLGNNRLPVNGYYLPEWQLYGRSFSPQIFIRGSRMMMSAAPRSAGGVYEEVAVENEMADYAAAAPDMIYNAVEHKQALSNVALKEDAVEVTEEAADADAGAAPTPAGQPEVEYRDSETPLAFFRPMLATGPDGRLELTFTVPNANATWALRAIAWTDDMRAAEFDATVLASKPVMVKPNAPRFLREGDSAVILTSVMNAIDSTLEATAAVELFDPSTGTVVNTITKTLTLEPRATVTLPVTAEAVPGTAMLGLRARVSTDTFADGEQLVMPVLPAATPVIDSEPFYLGPDTHVAEVVMPAAKDASDALTTLEFCENPVWYVVTALPGLAKNDPVTAPEAADALFSAAVARGLILGYPVIAEALREWTASGASSEELTSMLSRNEDLKQLALAATPWMMDARSDTERMQRLALLFDPERVERSISTSLGLLAKLQRQSGGWAWIAGIEEPSLWATETVLGIIATLDEYGFAPTDSRFRDMTARAVGYLDAEAVKSHRKYPKEPMTGYALLRASFPDVKESIEVKAIIDQATQAVVKGWKEWPVAGKPEAAMLLWRRDYRTVARQVLASMREYMVTSPEKGTFFPSLQNQAYGYLSYTARALRAFALIEPGCAEVDGLRHWLVVQKQATDWGSSAGATEVVAAILASSQEWLADAKGTMVKVNGKAVDVPSTDRRLGYFRLPVEAPATKAVTVTVDKPADTPAWGSVIRRSVRPLRSIEASACDDLSIEKSIIGSDSLAVGQKVTVRLVLHVNRNLNYVTVTDARAACFEPVRQLPSTQFAEGVCFYIEPRDAQTDIFVTTMPKGTYVLTYDLYVNNAGSFASGIATAASQYAPGITARSAGDILEVR